MRWQAVLPVRVGEGKSRLGADLTELFALDTLAAVEASAHVESVLVVGRRLGERAVIEDPGGGLNAAIAAGIDAADPDMPLVVILGDLPALRAEDLDAVLAEGSGVQHGFVADHRGMGTTMITVADRSLYLGLHFGPDSADLFAADGFTPLNAPASARCDIDTMEDLEIAAGIGLGAHTRAWMEETRK